MTLLGVTLISLLFSLVRVNIVAPSAQAPAAVTAVLLALAAGWTVAKSTYRRQRRESAPP